MRRLLAALLAAGLPLAACATIPPTSSLNQVLATGVVGNSAGALVAPVFPTAISAYGVTVSGNNDITITANYGLTVASTRVVALTSTGITVGGALTVTGTSTLTGNVTVGAGTGNPALIVNGASGSGLGPYVDFQVGSSHAGFIGTSSSGGLSSNNNDLSIAAKTAGGTGQMTFWTNNATLALTLDTSQNQTNTGWVKATAFNTVGSGSPVSGGITGNSAAGLAITGGYSGGAGSVYDLEYFNSAGQAVIQNPEGTKNLTFTGTQTVTNGLIGAGGSATGGTYESFVPIWVAVKSVTILTAATPANLATIVLPAGITRYYIPAASAIQCYAETAAGTLAGGTIQLRTATSGGGSQIGSTITPPAAVSTMTTTAGSDTAVLTGGTVYLYQTGNSANAGTVSVYIKLVPIL
jgi:hypothetical protein